MNEMPLVSVVMSVHNGKRYLGEAIQSILAQTLGDFEFIIIDDGSSDGSWHIMERWAARDTRIRPTRQQNTGLTAALNRGWRMARGPFIARMDADDVSLPQRFEKQIQYLRDHPEVVALGTQIVQIDPCGVEIGPMANVWADHERIDAELLRGTGAAIPHPTAMLRRQAMEAVGGYREEYRTAQDLDLFLRLAEHGRLANLTETLLKYRVHLSSTNYVKRQSQLDNARRIVQEAYRRRGRPMPEDFEQDWPWLSPAKQLRKWSQAALRAGHRGAAVRHALACWRYEPFSLSSYRLLARTLRRS